MNTNETTASYKMTALQNIINSTPELQGLGENVFHLRNQMGKIQQSMSYAIDFPSTVYCEDDYGQALDDAEETVDMYLYVMADMIGLNNLRDMRRNAGIKMNQLYRGQQEAYKAQKMHYEMCKARGWFSEEDRCFIQQKKNENEELWAMWDQERINRQEFCKLIEALDPEDADLGWDEE